MLPLSEFRWGDFIQDLLIGCILLVDTNLNAKLHCWYETTQFMTVLLIVC